jgi:hypothetical protein
VSRAWSGLRARPTLAAAILYALVALAFVSPALVPGRVMSHSQLLWFAPPWNAERPDSVETAGNLEVGDAPSVLYPLQLEVKKRLPEPALWNPYIQGGRPLLADAQSAPFSLFSLPSYVLPFYTSLAFVAALKLFVAALGTFLLGRSLGMRQGGALLAGAAYGLNLWLVTWLVYPHASVWALIPLLLFTTDRLVRRPDVLSGAGLAAVSAAVLFSGHPESVFHAFFAAALFFVLRVIQARRAGDVGLLRRTCFFAAGLGLGTLIAAAAVLPFLELVLRSADIADRGGTAELHTIDKRFLLGFALYDYWGRGTGTSIELFLLARANYIGALPLMLAAVALVLLRSALRIALAAFAAVCLAVAYKVPGVFDVVTAVPPFSSGHNNRLPILALLAIALLAGFGLDELSGRWAERRGAVLAIAAAILLAPLAWVIAAGTSSLEALGRGFEVAWLFAHPPPTSEEGFADSIRMAALLVWLGMAGAALLLLLLRARGLVVGTLFVALAVGLVCADLFRAGMGYNPAIDADTAAPPATPGMRYLESRRPARFVTFTRGDPVPQNVIPMGQELYEARGYDLPADRRYDSLWRRGISPEFPSQVGPYAASIPLSVPDWDADRLRTLSLLGVADVWQPPYEPPLRTPGLRLAYQGKDARIYANENALPRAFVVDRQRVVEGEDAALDAVVSPAFRPLEEAISEEPIAGVPTSGRGESTGRARITRYAPEQVEVKAALEEPGLLVLSDLHYPGWKAEVDGRDVPIERVDYALRGVPLNAGRHLVVFRYEPLSWRLGWIVSLLGLALLAGAVVAGLLARRRETTRSARPPHTRTGAP